MHIGLVHALKPSERRIFSRPEAASYLSASVKFFDKMVRQGVYPQPLPLPGVKRWDVRALDRVVDAMSGIDSDTPAEPVTVLDAWRLANDKN